MKEILSVLHFNCTSIRNKLLQRNSAGLQVLSATDERKNEWMDGWMDERNIVCVTFQLYINT